MLLCFRHFLLFVLKHLAVLVFYFPPALINVKPLVWLHSLTRNVHFQLVDFTRQKTSVGWVIWSYVFGFKFLTFFFIKNTDFKVNSSKPHTTCLGGELKIRTLVKSILLIPLFIGAVVFLLSYLYAYSENSNFEDMRKKSLLNCEQLPLHCLI